MQEQSMDKSKQSYFWLIAVVVLLMGLIIFLALNEKTETAAIRNQEQSLTIPTVTSSKDPDKHSEKEIKSYEFSEQLPLYGEEGWEYVGSEPLAELAESDFPFARALLVVSPELLPSLFKKELIRKSVYSINDMAQGLRPPLKRLREIALPSPFVVTKEADKMYISEQSYQRYDALAQAINAIDPQAAVNVYQRYLPLFQTVFAELSYPEDYQVLDSIKAATSKVIQAPVIAERVEVVQHSVRYKFADPVLEKLSSLDKQMLRMGPKNTRMIQAKLRTLIEALIALEEE